MHQLLDNPMIALTMALIHSRIEPLRTRSERGASALETAIIAAFLIAAAVVIGGIVLQKVRDGGAAVQKQEIPKP